MRECPLTAGARRAPGTGMTKLAALAALSFASATAFATPQEDLAFYVNKSTGSHSQEHVALKLLTFDVGKACWDKLGSKDGGSRVLYYTSAIERLEKQVTDNDWDHIEKHGKKEDVNPMVDKMIDDYAASFHLTVQVEGDDCDLSGKAMWVKYATNVMTQIVNTPPKTGKAFITIKAEAKAKDVTFTVGKDGSTFTLVGPRDFEPSGWPSKVDAKIEQVSKR
jgi:hypothetical protein